MKLMLLGFENICSRAIGRLLFTVGLSLAGASQAFGQFTWSDWRNGQSIGSFYSVAGTANETVAVGAMGSSGRIATRNNTTGIWVVQDFATSSWFRDVIYANNQYVAVREGGSIMTSPNGLTWTNQVSPTTNDLMTVLWDGNQYLAAGKNGTILTSTDAQTWTNRTSGTTAFFHNISYSGSQYVAVGNNIVRISTDGISWSAPVAAPPPTYFVGATWTGTRFIIGGLGFSTTPTLYGSSDGLTWTLLNSAFKEDIRSIVTVGGSVFITGAFDGTGNGFVYQTLDGVALTNTYLSPNGSEYFMGIAYNGSDLIVAGFNHNVFATAIPEPATYATLLGLASLGFAVWRTNRLRHRRQHNFPASA